MIHYRYFGNTKHGKAALIFSQCDHHHTRLCFISHNSIINHVLNFIETRWSAVLRSIKIGRRELRNDRATRLFNFPHTGQQHPCVIHYFITTLYFRHLLLLSVSFFSSGVSALGYYILWANGKGLLILSSSPAVFMSIQHHDTPVLPDLSGWQGTPAAAGVREWPVSINQYPRESTVENDGKWYPHTR